MRLLFCLSVSLAAAPLLAAPEIRVVFPPAGSAIDAAGKTHVLGSLRPAGLPLTVNGQTVSVWRTGGFVCMVPATPGTNTLTLRAGKAEVRHTFRVPYPPPAWDGKSIRAVAPLKPLGVYTGEAVRLACDAPAGLALCAQVGERSIALAPEPGSPTRYSARVSFAYPAEAAPVTFFAQGLGDARAAALTARAHWPAARVTGRLFETRARSEPDDGDTLGFLEPGLRLQGAGFSGDQTRLWLAGKLCYVGAHLLTAERAQLPPPPRDLSAPDLDAGRGPHPPTNRPPAGILIVLDPGHGDDATGAIGPCGVREKTVALQQAKAARKALEAAGFRVRLTREADKNPDLYARANLAYEARADAFIALHYNATAASSDPSRARHIATYYWNALGDSLARALHPRLAAATPITDGGVRQASFAVCRNPAVPSVLLELDFITDPEGEEAIQTPERQRRVSEALVAGLREWLGAEGARRKE